MEIVIDDSMSNRVNTFFNKLNEKINTPEQLAYTHLVKAEGLRIKSFFWESIDEYAISLQYAKSLDAYKGLGLSYKQTVFTQSAIGAFSNAKKLNPFDKTLYYETACCHCMDKKYDKAISEYKKALKICPDYVEAQLNLSLSYELKGHHKQAISGYLKIIEHHPENLSAYNALGSLYIKMEMHNKAISTFRDLLKISKDYSRAYLGIAIAYDKMDCTSRSLRYYRKYIKLKPNCANLPFILDRIAELRTEIIPAKISHLKLVS